MIKLYNYLTCRSLDLYSKMVLVKKYVRFVLEIKKKDCSDLYGYLAMSSEYQMYLNIHLTSTYCRQTAVQNYTAVSHPLKSALVEHHY